MAYYQAHREERLTYQKEYNKSEYYKEYQREYYQKNKERMYARHKERYYKKEKSYKPLPKYKLDMLERMLKRKLKDYQNSIIEEKKAIKYSDNNEAFKGFVFKNSSFTLVFD